MEANLETFENLEQNLATYGTSLKTLPHVVQYNKRDMPAVSPVDELRAAVNPYRAPDFEAVAKVGSGVFETLKGVAKLVLKQVASQGV
jgi:signal recognition particle receptor subunit beta